MALIETDPFGSKQQFDQGDGRCIRCGQAVCLPVQTLEPPLVQFDGRNIGQVAVCPLEQVLAQSIVVGEPSAEGDCFQQHQVVQAICLPKMMDTGDGG